MFFLRIAAIILLAAALFSGNFSFLKSRVFIFLNGNNENNNLILENESLKTELYNANNLNSKTESAGTWNYLRTEVFSTYPFNDKNIISINSGTLSGIEKKETVVAAPDILLGQIISSTDKTSLVRTIFDNNFTAAVKIGSNKINALLKGGSVPTLEMIDKNSDIRNGDVVYSADQNFPYGFKLGEVQMNDSDSNNSEPFKTAILKVAYNPALLDEVMVVTNFKPANLK